MLVQQPRETGGMSRTSETGETKRETTLLTSRFSRMSRASRATVRGAGEIFQHSARNHNERTLACQGRLG